MMHTLLDAAALNGGGAPVIRYLETEQAPVTVTAADFCRAVDAAAAALHMLGVRPRDLVVLAYTQNLESIFAFWGALRLGAIPSMFPTLTEKLDPDIYMRSMAELVRLSGVRAVLTTDEFAPKLATIAGCDVFGSQALRDAAARQPSTPDYTPHPDEIAFLQHSSGTTGLQKGVALSHRAVLNQLDSYREAVALNPDDVIVSWLPLYHDMGLIAGFLMPLVLGVPLVLMSPFDWVAHPALLLRAIHEHHGTLCWLPNFAYNHMARRIRQRDSDGLDLTSMRMFVNCSEPVHDDSHRQFVERFAANGVTLDRLKVSYAMAENTFAVTQTPVDQPARLDIVARTPLERDRRALPVSADDPDAVVKVSCGPAIRGTSVRVLDTDGHALPERYVGELTITSDCMLTGYYRRPDLNPFTPDGWYRTGDMGYLADGEVYVIGRIKDLIINAGKNVYPQDIEAIVNTVEGVRAGRAAVFGVYDDREGTELIAVVAEVSEHDGDTHKTLAQRIKQTVAAQSMVTVSYVSLVDSQWLIKTSSGKINRAANREKWLAERSAR
jgi:acyl-CoA synthetase (AMP-forming)/AMP-acid ligase II